MFCRAIRTELAVAVCPYSSVAVLIVGSDSMLSTDGNLEKRVLWLSVMGKAVFTIGIDGQNHPLLATPCKPMGIESVIAAAAPKLCLQRLSGTVSEGKMPPS